MIDKSYWTALRERDFAFPRDTATAALVHALKEALASPDPELRDALAYSAAATWIGAGELDSALEALGDAMAERLATHPEVQARTFAPLVLDSILERTTAAPPGLVRPAAVDRWYRAFADWYAAERETEGWSDSLGWLHAVAHGADAAAAFGGHPDCSPARREELLALCARRMTADDDRCSYAQSEDARLARAITVVLLRPGLTAEAAVSWLDIVEGALAAPRTGRPAQRYFNTLATLQSVHLHLAVGLAGGGLPPHAEPVRLRVLEVLRGRLGWLGRGAATG
ncbi:DUF2785 domain-containing protein [Streptomyces sp. NPDC004111]|uniref:DUF2785 domain-containing protein n=1 Tax=Streptomyces sp. NPDC004111 TaxID=3364690 RepID=UPI0036B803FE